MDIEPPMVPAATPQPDSGLQVMSFLQRAADLRFEAFAVFGVDPLQRSGGFQPRGARTGVSQEVEAASGQVAGAAAEGDVEETVGCAANQLEPAPLRLPRVH